MAAAGVPVRAGEIVRIRGERWRVVRRLAYESAAIIETTGCGDGNRGVHARFLLPCEPVDRIELSPVPRIVRPAEWRRLACRVLGDASHSWISLRAAPAAQLSIVPFQLEPALALMRGGGCRMLIADEVGLGKTIQAGLVIAEVFSRRPDARALVVCPAGLREQWREELQSRFHLPAEAIDAAAVARSAAALPPDMNPWSTRPLVITSIDYVKRAEVMRSLEPLIWDVVVFDEAHAFSGRSDRAAAARQLGDRARCVLMLTATPHSGDDEAFRRMCDIGRLSDDERLLMFRRTRTDAGLGGSRRISLLRVRPTAAEAAMHAALREYSQRVWRYSSGPHEAGARLAMSVLMRRACSSACSLQRSIERRMRLLDAAGAPSTTQLDLLFDPASPDDEEPDDVLGAGGLPDRADERGRLDRIRRLAREAACEESKLAALRRFILRTSEPAIVFTEYRDTLDQIAATLPDVTAVLLHGGLTASERAAALRTFVSGSVRLLLATDAASEGLNLQHRCCLVISLELPWNPLRLEQRAGRVDRIGQRQRVHAIHLVAGGTGEEFVLSRLVKRVRRIRAAVGASIVGLPAEEEIAAAVIADAPLPPGPKDPAYEGSRVAALAVPGLVAPDLRQEAHDEACRIELARTLLRAARFPSVDSRAIAPAIHRRRGRTRPDLFWLFKLLLTDARGCVLLEPLLALAASSLRPLRLGHPAELRSLIARTRPPLELTAIAMQQHHLDALVDDLRAPLKVWTARERAIATAFRERHARMSAGLLQRGLFDHRTDRAEAAQSALLDEVLGKSAERAGELSACEQVRVESCDLLWAVALY
jgi:superfamily II DNA or RNA helicase